MHRHKYIRNNIYKKIEKYKKMKVYNKIMFRHIILLFSILGISSLRILFSPGSLVKKTFYKDLIHRIEDKTNTTINFYNSFENLNESENIIISHSFGGTQALYHYLTRKPSNIIGIVLLQSHFNQRNKMPYFGINQHKIDIPVLTVLNTYDEKLPIHSSVDDFLVSYQEKIPNKYYLINNGTHFSSFENKIQIELLSSQIESFISELRKKNFYRMDAIYRYITNKHGWFFNDRELNNTINHSNILNFVRSKPTKNNSMYMNHKYIMYKTNDVNITKELDTYYYLNMVYNFTEIDIHSTDYANISHTALKLTSHILRGFNISTFYLLFEIIIKGVTNKIIENMHIPVVIYTWFNYEPRIYIQNKKLECEVLCIPIKDNIVYYKFPSKHKIFEFLIQKNLL